MTFVACGRTPALTVSCHDNLQDISQLWLIFQIHASSTLYQTYQWCRSWQNTLGNKYGSFPRILVARDLNGKVIFILPLQVRESFGLQILEWHGYPTVNYGYGLFDREFLSDASMWFAENLIHILELTGPFDVLALNDMPERMDGEKHPLRCVFNVKSANCSYAMRIQTDYKTLYAAKRSSNTHHSNRKKDKKLNALGVLKFGLPHSHEEAHSILNIMFEQKTTRLAESGVHGVFGTAEQEFVHQLVGETNEGKPLLMPYALTCDGKVLAVILGGYANKSCWLLISSLSQGVARKYSPGDYVLRHMIEDCCKLGFEKIDFASGEASYKSHWAEETIGLNATLKAKTLRGFLWVLGTAMALIAKRLVKQTPKLHQLALAFRRLIAGKKLSQ
jgi:CelD/BcsL family acetyltransferase involved in cellulose biosynthesis